MSPSIRTAWVFGGPLGGLRPTWAWAIVIIFAAIGGLFAYLSYRKSITRLPVPKLVLLAGARTAILALILLCLADPVRVERFSIEPPAPTPPRPRRLAVLVDRSDSMTVKDNRGLSRLDGAAALWRRLEPAAKDSFAKTRYYSFARDIQPAATLDEALAQRGHSDQTELYQSVASLLKAAPEERPDAIAVMTDGLDTTGTDASALRDAAVATQVPVYFVPGSNRIPPEPFLTVQEWRVPPVAIRNATFSINLSFEAFSTADRTVPFSLLEDGRLVGNGKLSLKMGANLVPWTFPVNSGEPGVRDFTLKWGDGRETAVAARASTLVQPRHPVRVLVSQGALDWGFRTLADALGGDPDFELTAQFAPVRGYGANSGAAINADFQSQLPITADGYQAYDCVVLARPGDSMIDALQQKALAEFVRNGGSVLFSDPGPQGARSYATGDLAELMPVVLDQSEELLAKPEPSALSDPRSRLESFSLTAAGRSSPIFKAAGGISFIPRFESFDPASQAKAGAEVLAIHPTAKDPVTGSPFILLATQSFGRGHVAFLATDGLWRWKMSEPSTSKAVDTFWRQLILAIAQKPPEAHLHFVDAAVQPKVGDSVGIRLGGLDAGHQPPEVAAKSPNGSITRLSLRATGDKEAPWRADWKPDQPGDWELAASTEGDAPTYSYPIVTAAQTGESARTPTAFDAMREIAASTGGALLQSEPPSSWRAPAVEATPDRIEQEKRRLLWNTWPMIGLILGLFATEMTLRRIWKLL